MTLSRGSIIAWAVVLSAVCGTAMAQNYDRLPTEIVAATATLSPDQHAVVSKYVSFWVEHLGSGSDTEVIDAREHLIDPWRRGPNKQFFEPIYSGLISKELKSKNTLGSDRVLVRVNVMIVVSNLVDPEMVGLVVTGLGDVNPGERYWAGKAVSQVAAAQKLKDAEEGQLLDALAKAIVTERNQPVVGVILEAMGDLNIPKATDRLLEVLNERVALHVANGRLSPQPESRAMARLLKRLSDRLSDRPNNPGGTPVINPIVVQAQVRQAARVLYRYLVLSATTLAQRPPQDKELAAAHWHMIEISALWLPALLDKLDPEKKVKRPASLKAAYEAKQIDEILLIADEWKGLLKQPPFGFSDDELSASAATAPAPATGTAPATATATTTAPAN